MAMPPERSTEAYEVLPKTAEVFPRDDGLHLGDLFARIKEARLITGLTFEQVQEILRSNVGGIFPDALQQQLELPEYAWSFIDAQSKMLPLVFLGHSRDDTQDMHPNDGYKTAEATIYLDRYVSNASGKVYAQGVSVGGVAQDTSGQPRAVAVEYSTIDKRQAHRIAISVSDQEAPKPESEWSFDFSAYDQMNPLPTDIHWPRSVPALITPAMLAKTATEISGIHTRAISPYDATATGDELELPGIFYQREPNYYSKHGFTFRSDRETHTLSFSPRDVSLKPWFLSVSKSLHSA